MSKAVSDFDSIQEVMRAVVGPKNDSGLSVQEWAHRLGHAPSTMYAKGGAVPFTLDDLVKVVASGFLPPLKWLAQVGHAVVFEMPKSWQGGCLEISKAATSTLKFGKYLESFSSAIAPESEGGVAITPIEAANIKENALNVVADMAAIIEAMDELLRRDQ